MRVGMAARSAVSSGITPVVKACPAMTAGDAAIRTSKPA